MLRNILNPTSTVAVGIGIGALDLLIFSHMVPSVTDIRTARPQNTDVESTRKQATIACAGINGLVSLMTGNWDVFLIGGMVTIGMSYMVAHANEVNPDTGKMVGAATQSIAPDTAGWNLSDYGMQEPAQAS